GSSNLQRRQNDNMREIRDRHQSQVAGVLDESAARLSRYPVALGRKVRAQNELALETARFETAVCLDDFIEGNPLGDARPDGASCQHAEESLQVLPEPGGMPPPHPIDRVDADALPTRHPTQQPPPYIHARNPHQDGGQATPRLDARRVAIGAEQAARLKG